MILLLVAVAAMSPGALDCPERPGAVLMSSSTGALRPGNEPVSLCAYGVLDGSFVWLDELLLHDPRRPGDDAVLGYPAELQALGLFPASEVPSPQLEDLNFDGVLDVKLASAIGATGNVAYNVWLSAARSGEHRYSDALSGLGRLEAHPETQTLSSYWNAGGGSGTSQTLRWIGGVPTVVEEIATDWNAEKSCREAITRRRTGSELAVVSRTCLD